ncbi:MAG: hypothetical protein WCF44_06665 [Candidatus Methylophosphatis roskildensis]
MSSSVPPVDEAMGVECAWPVREGVATDQPKARRGGETVRKHAWQAIAAAVVVALLSVGGWSLKDSAIDISTVLPSGVPTHTE